MIDGLMAKKVERVIDLAHQAGFDINFGFTIHLFTHGDPEVPEYQSTVYDKPIVIFFNSVEEVSAFLMGLKFKTWYDEVKPEGAYDVIEMDLRK
jgi:hypothetical protein